MGKIHAGRMGVVVVGVVSMVVAAGVAHHGGVEGGSSCCGTDDSFEGRKWDMEKLPGHRHKIHGLGKNICFLEC